MYLHRISQKHASHYKIHGTNRNIYSYVSRGKHARKVRKKQSLSSIASRSIHLAGLERTGGSACLIKENELTQFHVLIVSQEQNDVRSPSVVFRTLLGSVLLLSLSELWHPSSREHRVVPLHERG
jgi:hypothetical protein